MRANNKVDEIETELSSVEIVRSHENRSGDARGVGYLNGKLIWFEKSVDSFTATEITLKRSVELLLRLIQVEIDDGHGDIQISDEGTLRWHSQVWTALK